MKALAQSLALAGICGTLILVCAFVASLVASALDAVFGETIVTNTLGLIDTFILPNAALVFLAVAGGVFIFLMVDHIRNPDRPF
jgi:hypothetical protein